MRKNIVVCGGIAVGKTTLCRQIVERFPDASLVEEIPEENRFLSRFYDNPERWSFHSRIGMLSLFLRNYTNLPKTTNTLIYDRSIHELVVFANLHLDKGYLSKDEYCVYRDLYDAILNLIEAPDLFICLECSTKTSLSRIKNRGREFELNIEANYITQVSDSYREWLGNRVENSKLIVLNTDENYNLDQLLEMIKNL
jgi:deoxyadenosine/deoxycytidine kinase